MRKKEISNHLMKRLTSASILCGFTMASTQSYAMPYYKQNEALKQVNGSLLAADPLLSGASLFADHDPSNEIVYVSPSSKKLQTGVYQVNATPACNILANQYALTYYVPSEPATRWREVAQSGPFSAYFDHNFGNYIRQARLLDELANKIGQIESMRARYPREVQAYTDAKQALSFAQERDNAIQAQIDSYSNRIDALSRLLGTASAEEVPAIRSEIETVRAEFEVEKPQLREEKRQTQRAVIAAEQAYSSALGAYEAVIPNETELVARIQNLTTVFQSIQTLSSSTVSIADMTLLKMETAGVGTASASYSIWGQEEAALKNLLNQSGSNFAAARLPIFNVVFKQAQQSDKPSSVDADVLPASEFTPSVDNSTSVSIEGATPDATVVTNAEGTDLPVFDNNGVPVVPKKDLLTSAGAGTFTRLVSRGAYCTGDSDRNIVTEQPSGVIGGELTSFNFPLGVFKSRNRNVLAQSVALEYDFNLKTDPISVTCQMDIDRFRKWTNKKGSSGFLFWRKGWSKEQREAVDESSLRCDVDISEQNDGTVASSTARVDAIKQGLMQDMASEFILTYAKSYEMLKSAEPAVPNVSAAAERFGVATAALCGPNVYCQVGSIVLKNGAELFGSNKGSSSGEDHLKGVIRRSYSERSYITKAGQATIDLTVTL